MKDLSPEASELVYAGREAFSPTDADRARILATLTGAATLATGAAAAASTTKLSGAGLRGLSWLARLARISAVGVPMAAGGAWLYGHDTAASSHAPAAVRPAIVASAQPVASPAVSEPPVSPSAHDPAPATVSDPDPTALPERSVAPADSSRPGAQFRQEVALLSKAQAELSRGRPGQALESLGEHARRFPRGTLTEERMATRVRALCALGRVAEAESELKRVERLYRNSAYVARAREACGAQFGSR